MKSKKDLQANLQEILNQNERQYRDILGGIEDGYYEVDIKGNLIFFNDSLCKIYGYTREELLGMNNREYMSPETAKKTYDVFNTVYRTGEPTKIFDWKFIKKDGSKIDVEISVSLIKNLKGEGVGFRGIVRDVGERKRIEMALKKSHNDLERLVMQRTKDLTETNKRLKLEIYERKQVDYALRESEEKYRMVVEHANEAITVTQDGMLKFINPKAIEISGYSEQELLSIPFIEFVHPDDQQMVMQHHLRRIKGEESPELYVLRFIAKNGDVNWVENNGVIIKWEGKPATLNLINDITDRKQAEDALRESEDKFKIVAEQSPNMLFINKNGRILYANDRCLEMGYSKDELYSSVFDFRSLLAPVSQKLADDSINRHMENIEVPPLENTLVKKDRSQIHAMINTKLIDYEGGKAILGVVTDITQQKEFEKALAAAKNQWEATFDAISDWVALIDKDHNVIRSNNALKSLLKQSPDHVVGKRCNELIHGTDCPIPDCPLERAVTSKQRETMEIQIADGRWIQITVEPIKSEDSATLFVHIVRDITERKWAEEKKAKLEAQNRLLHKDESLARMAGAIAHHFNNQLSVVLGNLELALDDLPADAPTRDHLKDALEATRRSTDISGLMLTYLGQVSSQLEPLNLSNTCRRFLPVLQSVAPKSVSLETDFMAAGPVIRANSNQLLQVLTHMVTNGVEAMGEHGGRVKVAVRILPTADIPEGFMVPIDWKPSAERYGCLEVADTGGGISERDMEKIFDPFFTTKFTGRGLGLAVVLGIVKTWDGAICVKSWKDRGCTIRVVLPLLEDETAPAPMPSAGVLKAVDGGTVLLVEDQTDLRELAGAMLVHLGYSVISAADGAEAVNLFRKHLDTIRCVITDLSMPGMDGWETLAALRKIQPGLPVILSSGYDEAVAMERDEPEKPTTFLHKPYSMDAMKQALSRALG